MQKHHDDAPGRWPSTALPRLKAPPTAAPGARPIHSAGRLIRFGFQVGQFHLLLTPDTFSEVVQQAVIYPLPNVPRWFLGLLNQRNNLLPVFDLHRFLSTGDIQNNKRTVLVLDQRSDAVGLCIDGPPQAVILEQPLPHLPPLPEALVAHVPTAYRSGGTVWFDFDHRGFFTITGAQITRQQPVHLSR